ncbi:unnamed protein product [Mytilus coruscus]|uniref:Reverse transcriptase domain-containing protein n=1 Tax=Mytilus coruscus TaxID=42192 RepID=A0A6J8D330_MYTCO|nr:unnamed protein product [Mytilus coruscus]
MGLGSSAFICQRITNAVTFIAGTFGVDVINYLDDFAGADCPKKAQVSFEKSKSVLDQCGLEESAEKACEPCLRMSFLGVWFDTEKMTLEVTPDRLIEISELVVMWLNKEKARKKEVQSLLGKLNFVSSCVKPGRIFISEVLNFLREFSNNDQVLDVSNELRRDMLWWSKLLLTYNGISIISLEEWTEPDLFFSCDACLTGCGGMSDSEYFHCEFPEFISEHNFHINALEQ